MVVWNRFFENANSGLYHYAANNPVKYTDPTGMWHNNHDGTFTAQEGDTLWEKFGADWKEKSGFDRDPRTLQVGETVGKKVCEVKSTPSNKGVDLNFFANNSYDKNIHNYANLVNNPNNEFVIGGHGSTKSFVDINYQDVSPEYLAKLIKENPNYKEDMPIRMLSCNLGGNTIGYDNYAQRLANAMGTGAKVYGATELCWFYPNGDIVVAGRNLFFKNRPSWFFRRGEFKCFIGK